MNFQGKDKPEIFRGEIFLKILDDWNNPNKEGREI